MKLHSGYVIDLLSRNTTQGSHPHESLSKHVGARDLGLQLSKEASKHVNREMLLSDVMQEVVFFYKELGHADWRFEPTHKRTLERMVEIVKLKKTALTCPRMSTGGVHPPLLRRRRGGVHPPWP